jgi:hypothetical protein
MYDATSPASIGTNVPDPEYVAGYIDGHWRSYAGMQARFPHAIPVSITVFGATNADVADCEAGDLTPSQAAAWAKARIAAGFVPCIYVSSSWWSAVISACIAVGVPSAAVDWWIAAYPGPGAVLYPGAVAHQWIDHGAYDESVVEPGWVPGRAIAPPHDDTPPPAPYLATLEGQLLMVIPVPLFTTDANGWTAQGVSLPAGKTNKDIVSVVCDAASAFDQQGWHFCQGAPDFSKDGRIVFKSLAPNDSFTARVFVTD